MQSKSYFKEIALTLLPLALFSCNERNSKEEGKKNVLFIAVDDLRPELNCYGAEHIHSPNMDRLAMEGVQFTRAYCNIPVSGASRASLLTGTRPTYNRWIHHNDRIDEMLPDVPTIGKYFRDNGYHTVHNSKIMHHPGDAKGSWTEEWWPDCIGSWRNYANPKHIQLDTTASEKDPAYECYAVPDTAYKDGKTAMKAIQDLKRLKDQDKPFFLGVGFFKPHLPFNAPKKYWDLYDPAKIQFPEYQKKSLNAPDESMHNSGELRAYRDIPPTGRLSDTMARNLIHGYYACVSYIDAQVGKVLNALDEMGLSDNTIVVLWGDHGWNLREHGLWCKHCNFETSLHAPLIIKDPDMKKGRQTDAVAEFVDIYPTLCELCDVGMPGHLEGKSLLPVIKNPEGTTDGIAVSRWHDGTTIIDPPYFYTEWVDSTGKKQVDMLYDHAEDPKETVDISGNTEHKKLVEKLDESLRAHWGNFIDKTR